MRVACVSAKLIPARATSTTTSPVPGLGVGKLDQLHHLGTAEALDPDRLHDASLLRMPRLMSLTVVGSIAFDCVRTPFGERERMLGGSAVHFALAASFFTEVRVVGPVGDDFGDEQLAVLASRGIDTDDIERVAGGETFFWRGHYEHDMNVAHTDDTQLNVFARLRAEALAGVARGARCSSSATSSPTSSATSAAPVGGRASRRSTR